LGSCFVSQPVSSHRGCLFPLISGFSAKIIENPTQTPRLIFAYLGSRLSGKLGIHMNFAFLQRGIGDAYVIIERFFLAYPCPSPSIAHPRILSSRRRRPSLLWIRAGASYTPRAGAAPPPLQHPCPDLRRRPASRPDGSSAWRPYRPPCGSVPPSLQAPNASTVRHPCMLPPSLPFLPLLFFTP